jgi:hypothetical protein
MTLNQTKDREKFHENPEPKWKRMPLPEGVFDPRGAQAEVSVTAFGRGTEVIRFEEAVSSGFMREEWLLENRLKAHLGEGVLHYVNGYYTQGYAIRSKAQKSPDPSDIPVVRVEVGLDGEKTLHVANNLIVAEDGCALTVVMDYSKVTDAGKARHLGITRLIAGRGARVTLFKIQRTGLSDVFIDQTFLQVEEGAEVHVVDVQLGGQFRGVNYSADLVGRRSKATVNALYLGGPEQRMDLSYTMRHIGALSESEILSKGALNANAQKVFRGNLLFEKGSVQSVGREHEAVMLLDERAHSESIPALLCAEDDVVGEHAASVGRMDQEKLFYLMSRGLTPEAAKKLVVKAAFESVLAEVETVGLRTAVESIIDRRLS